MNSPEDLAPAQQPDELPTVSQLLMAARQRLASAPFRPSLREAGLLLCHVLGWSEARLLTHDQDRVPAQASACFAALLTRRLAGEPVAYLFGGKEFYGRPFSVDSRVLIPRPETEHLIARCLDLQLPQVPRILDLGTGSGCIAITLALELPGARVVAADLSLAALQVAQANCRRHQVSDRVRLVQADLTHPLSLDKFDLVVSNPPYVNPEEAAQLSPELNFEPRLALFAPENGRGVLRQLLAQARRLAPGKHLVFEIGYDQSEWLEQTVAATGQFALIEFVRDLSGIPRTAVLCRKAPPLNLPRP